MIRLPKKTQTSHPSRLRVVRSYLLSILVCTLLLFSVSLISLVRQQDMVNELSLSNLKFAAERTASELEEEIRRLAAETLRRDLIESLHFSAGDGSSLEKTRELRRRFEDLRRTHPIAEDFFIFTRGGLIFPRSGFPPVQTFDALLPTVRAAADRQFAALLTEAEEKERRSGQPGEALRLYRRAENLGVSRRLKALAAFRAAQALYKESGLDAAAPAYRGIWKTYGDEYDEAQTPYALVVALQPDQLASRVFRPFPQSMLGIYQDLISGRWELCAELADYCLARLERRLGIDEADRSNSDFLDHFSAAKAATRGFSLSQALPPYQVNSREFRRGNKACQLYYVVLPNGKDREAIAVGFSASLPWIRKQLLPEYTDRLGQSMPVSLVDDPAEVNEPKDLYIPFRTIGWRFQVPAVAIQTSEAAAHRELWFIGLSVVMFLCVLSLGIYLLIRVSWDIRWFQLRSDFVSGVSHELKTPLSLIRLYSETLVGDEQGFPPEERKSFIRIIARESERLSRLIDNVLDFTKIEQGRKRYDLSEGDLAATVSQTVEDYSDYLNLRGYTVRTGIQPNLPPVKFSREEVSQAVLNLMDNARKYSGTSRLIRVHMWLQDQEVAIEVQDYGIGIPGDEKEKIFQPFYRVANQTEKGGCGLGLYLVRQVMDGHRGRIEVESDVGKGSRFRLFFPVARTAEGSLNRPERYEAAASSQS